ncbi:MAG: DUF3291 domain-containing protein, partial [Acidobacteriaceae bacterium]|nr:DUF3291 domain-containing protein [Acidobacteriaceae bacterium]
VAQLDPVNSLAEGSPGFVWRLQSESGNATEIAYNDDPFVIVNMSVWLSVEALKNFVYRSRQHLDVFRDRQKWFEKMNVPHYCLWWIPAGHIPTVTEGRARLEHYQQHGSRAVSFWFSELQPEPSGELAAV